MHVCVCVCSILAAYEELTNREKVDALLVYPSVGVVLLVHQILFDMHSSEFGVRTSARNAAGTLVQALADAARPCAALESLDVAAVKNSAEQALAVAVTALLPDIRMSMQTRSSAIRGGVVGVLAETVQAFAGFAHPMLYAGPTRAKLVFALFRPPPLPFRLCASAACRVDVMTPSACVALL